MTENERLSMDEVIEHCNSKVEMMERFSSRENCESWSLNTQYGKEYWEHRQVAEWLKEIQAYRAIGTVEELQRRIAYIDTINEICSGYSAIGTIDEFKALKEKEERFDRNIRMFNEIGLEIRANTIEEFANELKKHKFHSNERYENCVPVCHIDWIASRMKGGVKDE